MSLYFVLNNLHFSLEALGALTFMTVSWLAYDSFKIRKDFLTASRGVGFLFLALWQTAHALGFSSDLWGYGGYLLYFLGLILVIWNLILEAPVSRPEFKAVIALPAVSGFIIPFSVIAAAGNLAIAILAFRQYRRELKYALFQFIVGFGLLSFGAGLAVFYQASSFNFLWLAGHLAELAGFGAIGWWVWRYLELRIREEMLLIFVSLTLVMAIAVSLTFSTILISRQEAETTANLSSNVKVLDFAISRLKEEALAKAELLGVNTELKTALAGKNFTALEELLGSFIVAEKLGLVTVVDGEGYAVMRAHAPTSRDDFLGDGFSARSALGGKSAVNIESGSVEGFSITASAPIPGASPGDVAGAVMTGFQLDNAFSDSIRKITGLEMSIYEGSLRVATTGSDPGGKGRATGIKETNSRVLEAVLKNGNDLTLRTTISSRPFLASYLPLKNAENKIVGMISAAKSQEELLKTAQATNRLTLLVVSAIMLILVMPIYAITKRLSEEVTR